MFIWWLDKNMEYILYSNHLLLIQRINLLTYITSIKHRMKTRKTSVAVEPGTAYEPLKDFSNYSSVKF